MTARGIDRRDVFVDDRDRRHFLDLLKAITERFRVKIHAYVLMNNHYHLVLETPEANLSRAMQWLNVSYAAWFNRRTNRAGPLFQGRFKSILVEDASWALSLSVYVHLNPVMRKAFGLDKRGKRIEMLGVRPPSPKELGERLRALRTYPWSSYRGYAGYSTAPAWLTTRAILSTCGAGDSKRTERYRVEVQNRLRMGGDESQAEKVRDTFAVGQESFRAEIRRLIKAGRETVRTDDLRKRHDWATLLKMVENTVGENSDVFIGKRGHPGRAMLLWAAHRYGGLTLQEAGAKAGGMDYTAVSMAIRRLEDKAAHHAGTNKWLMQLKRLCEM